MYPPPRAIPIGDSSFVATSTTVPPSRGTLETVPAALRVIHTDVVLAARRVIVPRFFATVRGMAVPPAIPSRDTARTDPPSSADA
jgi:hypothetical protein